MCTLKHTYVWQYIDQNGNSTSFFRGGITVDNFLCASQIVINEYILHFLIYMQILLKIKFSVSGFIL